MTRARKELISVDETPFYVEVLLRVRKRNREVEEEEVIVLVPHSEN